tara:strand:- start:27323 stop:28525 length:1203 start_codon:yes stop_codon:yes gene_type:complete
MMKIHAFAMLQILLFFFAFTISMGLAHADTPMTIYGTFDRASDDTAAKEPEGSQFRKGQTIVPQSSITIYGTINVGLRRLSNVNAEGGSTLKMSSLGEYYGNRIGFKGVEDLGDGLNAHFHIEAGFNSGTGALDNKSDRLFNRISSVGMAGSFGTIDLGRQPSVAVKTVYAYEPFRFRYVYIIPLAGAAAGDVAGRVNRPFGTTDGPRFSNGVQYFGKFNNFTVGTEYIFGEASGDNNAGSAKALGLSYKSDPFVIGGAVTRHEPNVATAGKSADYQAQNQFTYGAAYEAGALRLAGGYMRTDTDTGSLRRTQQTQNLWLGGSYEFTPTISLTAGHYRTTLSGDLVGRRDLTILSVTYALSQWTNLYAEIDHATLTGVASLAVGGQSKQLGISTGINHAF